MASTAYSTWRTDKIEIEAGEMKDFAFFDTKPNLFYLQNPDEFPIYIGLDYIPNVSKFEFKIEKNSSDVFGRPLPCSHIYLLNPSSKKMLITLYSIADMFNIEVLKNLHVDLSNQKLNSNSIIAGFQVPLPKGDNKIGSVEIQPSTNHIGNVTLYDLGQNVSETLKSWTYTILSNIYKKVSNISDNNISTLSKSYTYKGTSSTKLSLGSKYNMKENSKFTLINDGSEDVNVEFINPNSNITMGNLLLKSGEKYSNIKWAYITGIMELSPVVNGHTFEVRFIVHGEV